MAEGPWEDYAQGPWNDYSPAAKSPDTASSQQASYSAMEALKDFGSAAVRPLVKAASGLPLMAMDAGVAARNLVTGNFDPSSIKSFLMGSPKNTGATDLPSQTFNEALDKYTRAPTSILGKASEFASTALAGSALPLTPTIKNPAPSGFTAAAPQSALTGAQQRALQSGQDIGMRATPGQALGSKPLQQLEAKLESQPWTSGPLNAIKAGNQGVLNREAAQSIGENSPTVDASVLGRANERLGQVFESTRSASKQLAVDPKETEAALKQIDSDFEGLLPNDGSILDNKLVSRLSSLTQEGKINGEQLGSLASKLGKAAYKQMSGANGDRDLGQALYAVKSHVDDLVEKTLSGDEAATYGLARQQYRALMQLTSRVGTTNPSTGNVSGGALANYLQQTDRQGFLYGKNQSPVYNAARFAQAFKPIVGDSGTATRMPNLFNPLELAGGIPMNLATRAYLSRPGMAAIQRAIALRNSQGLLSHPELISGLLAAQASEAGQQ